MSPVDAYLATVSPQQRDILESICSMVRQLYPDTEETTSYGMPTFKYRGKGLLAFAVRRNHIGLYPFSSHAIEKSASLLDGFECSKGTIRFTVDHPLPLSTVQEILKLRTEQINSLED